MKTLLEIYGSGGVQFKDSAFTDGQDTWTAPYLYAKAKEQGLQCENVNLRHLPLNYMPWEDGNMRSLDSFLCHVARIQECDLSIPIIIGWDGYIMDGWHRVAKAILEGRKTIRAYRFEKYIPPDKEGKN